MHPTPIHGLTNAQLAEQARARLPCGYGVARRLHRDAMLCGRFAPHTLGLGARARSAWCSEFNFRLPELISTHPDKDDHGATTKIVLRLDDGYCVEAVRIPMGYHRSTLCVSSQVGCKMSCRFCETAQIGFVRNLRADEIVAQLLVAKHILHWPIRNIVFMGMGEPLNNAKNVISAIRILNDEASLAIGQERLTVCTVGNIEGIGELAHADFKRLNLSISLNAASDTLRNQLIPAHRRISLTALQRSLVAYRPRRNFTLGVNYCLLPNINDRVSDAKAVAVFCSPLGRVLVHVIPYNPGSAPLTHAPSARQVDRFIAMLRSEGLPVRRRITKGRSVTAACGQLGHPMHFDRRSSAT